MMEVTNISPFRRPSVSIMNNQPSTPPTLTPRRIPYESLFTGSLPELTTQSPLKRIQRSKPESNLTTPPPTICSSNPTTPPSTTGSISISISSSSSSSSNSSPPLPPPHASGTVIDVKGLSLRKPIYMNSEIKRWDLETPVPDDFSLFGEIDDLIDSFTSSTEADVVWNDPLGCISNTGKFFERLQRDEEYVLQDEIIDQYYDSDFKESDRYSGSEASLTSVFQRRPSLLRQVQTCRSTDSLTSSSQQARIIDQKLPTLPSQDQTSSPTPVTKLRSSDPLPNREQRMCDSPIAPARAWRSFSSESPSLRRVETIPESAKMPFRTPSGSIPRRLSYYEKRNYAQMSEESYIIQTFQNIGNSLDTWIDKYARGPRKMSWGDLPLKTKGNFKRIAHVAPDLGHRFQHSSECRAILIRQMVAHLMCNTILDPILFGLSTNRENFAMEYATVMELDRHTDPMKYKEWEHKFVNDETTRPDFGDSLAKKVMSLRNQLDYDLAPLLPMKSETESGVNSSANSQRMSDMHDILLRCVLLNVELKKRPELYEYNFLSKYTAWSADLMKLDAVPDGKWSPSVKKLQGIPIYAVVWPALMRKTRSDTSGRILVKARVILQPMKGNIFRKARSA